MCGYCSGQKQLVSDTLYEYSFSRFLEQYFYNSSLQKMNGSDTCSHCPLQDYTRWFHMADGSVIQFKFKRHDVYSIELVNIKEQNNNHSKVVEASQLKCNRIKKLLQIKNTSFNSQYSSVINQVEEHINAILLSEAQERPNPAMPLPEEDDTSLPNQGLLPQEPGS